jgi:hypothetical protein
MLGASLILLAGFLEGNVRIAVWVGALAIDYLGHEVVGSDRAGGSRRSTSPSGTR